MTLKAAGACVDYELLEALAQSWVQSWRAACLLHVAAVVHSCSHHHLPDVCGMLPPLLSRGVHGVPRCLVCTLYLWPATVKKHHGGKREWLWLNKQPGNAPGRSVCVMPMLVLRME
jgi:hypothetical protein